MIKINFGTDGWRGIIADAFTVQNLKKTVQAIMTCLKKESSELRISIGYDTRFMSEHYARAVAEVAIGNGAKVMISPCPVTTPMLSYSVKALDASGGIMVTASHNPYNYNGIKFKASYGGSALPGITREIESCIGKGPVLTVPYEKAREQGGVVETDFFGLYNERLTGILNLKAMRKAGLKTVLDCMHGSAGYHARRLWEAMGLELNTLNAGRDPYFGGINPEPLERNMGRLISEVKGAGYDLGIATDGDADRIGVVDGSGNYVTPHQALALLIMHLHRNRGLEGAVVKTVSTSHLIDRVARDLGLPVIETPVGFKHICEQMLTGDVLIGGEENGGIGIKGHIPERDGLLAALLLIEMMAVEGKGLGGLVADMEKKYGRLYFKRHDAHIEGLGRNNLPREIKDRARTVYKDFGVKDVKAFDGVKVLLDDGSWVLFRLSGTEQLLRIYSEASDPVKVEKLIQKGREVFVG